MAPRRHGIRRFSDPAMYDLELCIGPTTQDTWATMEDWEALWVLRRDEILERWALLDPGWRPWAWWVFEALEDPPSRDCQAERLLELGVSQTDAHPSLSFVQRRGGCCKGPAPEGILKASREERDES